MSLARDEGYAGITIPAICAAAQISKRTFYEHFESKDEAFTAAFDVALAGSTRAPGRRRASRGPGPRRSVPGCAPGWPSSPPSPSWRASGSAMC